MAQDAKRTRRTEGVADVTGVPSHRDVADRVADADRFAISLPVVGRVPFPRPDQLAFYAALAGLVVVELVEWPVAVAIGAGHALLSQRQEKHDPDAPSPE
jgi:hypothetical protein